MTIFAKAARSADARNRERIEKAKEARNVDPALISRQVNDQFHDRVVRACLPELIQGQDLTAPLRAVTAACPEVLVDKCYHLGWGAARQQKDADDRPPELFERYQRDLAAKDFSFVGVSTIRDQIGANKLIKSGLLCHGLSPTPDSVLLLADIGRASRICHALQLPELVVMLSDVSWVKHNRSVLKHFSTEEDYVDRLRVCQDKRRRIYDALNLRCDIFSISEFGKADHSVGVSGLKLASENYRRLAKALWGPDVLKPHDADIKAIIGQPFTGVSNKSLNLLPEHMKSLAQFDSVSNALEQALAGELRILRALSELFSSFDEDIFVYYFAQFFAQEVYDNFLKVAVSSESKFDNYFESNAEHFRQFASSRPTAKNRRVPTTKKAGAGSRSRKYLYMPQYRLGQSRVLPYSSLSLDVVKQEDPVKFISENLILLTDCNETLIDENKRKIRRVLEETPIGDRNRLISDLLSFCHMLVSTATSEFDHGGRLKGAIHDLDNAIGAEIYSENMRPNRYQEMFAQWMTALDDEKSVFPFHIVPYTWDEDEWGSAKALLATDFIFELLRCIRGICE